MASNVRAYTEVGKRIAALGKRQKHIARVLGVSQQTVSKKLRGETAILLSDLEKLGAHYKVPLTYFFEETPGPPELVVAWERIRRTPGAIQSLVVLLDRLSPADVQRILEIARVVGTSEPSGPASEAVSANPGPAAGSRAAEEGSPNGGN